MFIPIDRRDFLRHAAALGAALPFAGFGRAAAAETELVARKVFFDNPDVGSVRISPDGQTLAWLAPVGGVRNLFVAPLAGSRRRARGDARHRPQSVDVFSLGAHQPPSGVLPGARRRRELARLQRRYRQRRHRAADAASAASRRTGRNPTANFPMRCCSSTTRATSATSTCSGSISSPARAGLLFENNEFAWYVTDSDFQLRLGVRFAADGSAENMVRRPDGSLGAFLTVPIGDLDSTKALDFSADGKTLYVLDTRGRDKAALFAVDMATRQRNLARSRRRGRHHSRRLRFQSTLPARRARQQGSRALACGRSRLRRRIWTIWPSYGPGDVEIIDRSADNRFMTVFYERDTESGEFALLDRQTRKVRSLFRQRKALAGLALQKMQPVIIPARDGLRLNGYLTLPAAGAGRLPMVLVIHGGPYLRDVWGFNSIHQWLANRGYAVLSVNYRGSTGFGKAFVTAADKEWGGKMHDDLIDAVDWAVGAGHRRPEARRLLRRQLWRLLGADRGDQDARGVRLHRRPVRHFQSHHLHGDDPALLGTVVQHLEEPARRSRDRARPRLPDRTLAADAYRPRGASDPDRARHAGRAGGGGRIRADGELR